MISSYQSSTVWTRVRIPSFDEQKKQIAYIDSKYKAKVAERKILKEQTRCSCQ